jgi:hypothetical protein
MRLVARGHVLHGRRIASIGFQIDTGEKAVELGDPGAVHGAFLVAGPAQAVPVLIQGLGQLAERFLPVANEHIHHELGAGLFAAAIAPTDTRRELAELVPALDLPQRPAQHRPQAAKANGESAHIPSRMDRREAMASVSGNRLGSAK